VQERAGVRRLAQVRDNGGSVAAARAKEQGARVRNESREAGE